MSKRIARHFISLTEMGIFDYIAKENGKNVKMEEVIKIVGAPNYLRTEAALGFLENKGLIELDSNKDKVEVRATKKGCEAYKLLKTTADNLDSIIGYL